MVYELDPAGVRSCAGELSRLAGSAAAAGPTGLSLPGDAAEVATALVDLVRVEQRVSADAAGAIETLAGQLRDVAEQGVVADRSGWGAR